MLIDGAKTWDDTDKILYRIYRDTNAPNIGSGGAKTAWTMLGIDFSRASNVYKTGASVLPSSITNTFLIRY